jgi:hypothetical protein
MPDALRTERVLINQFVDAMRALPNVTADSLRWDIQLPNGSVRDAEVDLHIAGKRVRLEIEAKKTLYPRDVREILWRLRPYSKPLRQEVDAIVSVLAADSISPGAKQLLKEEGIGYFDSGGSVYLPAPGAYIHIDKPPPKGQLKSFESLYSGVRAQVLHALLHHHRAWIGGQALALQAHVSPATASQVLSELERLEFVESRGQGPHKQRHVTQPGALLDSWVKRLAVKRAPALRRYFVPALKADNPLPLAHELAARGVEYAISYEAAAQHYAPFITHVSQVRARVLMSAEWDVVIAGMNAQTVEEGANFTVIDAKSSGELLFREQAAGVSWANPIQVYLDLQRGEGRSHEMAEHLRRERIGF